MSPFDRGRRGSAAVREASSGSAVTLAVAATLVLAGTFLLGMKAGRRGERGRKGPVARRPGPGGIGQSSSLYPDGRLPETRYADGRRPGEGRTRPERLPRPSFAAMAMAEPAGNGTWHGQVRDSGPQAMRDPLHLSWDKVDEMSDQSFPASDPPSLY